ncbi:MAG: VWA domain-containing protein [Oscillochloris sp.]|nr:VWA domain-containing protein [Oscillochloris sp.]
MSLLLSISPPATGLLPQAESQLTYALLRIAADSGGGGAPVHWAVVADASRSMRIPIVSDEQFRALARSGDVQEVLVDGVPVWQLAGPVPEDVRAAAPSALDHTARALHSMIERLDRADRLVLIACAEEAFTLVSAGGGNRAALVAGIARLPALRLGDLTNLAPGLQSALAEFQSGNADVLRRIVLITDGFVRDADACLDLARTAAELGVAVSTFGLGSEFQLDLATRLADITGGRASFLRRPDQIPAAVAAELDAARGVVARALTVELRLPQGVTLRRATRLRPALAPLEAVGADPRRPTFRLGDLGRGDDVQVLLELLAPPVPPRPVPGGARIRLAEIVAQSGANEARADLVGHYRADASPPAPTILAAAARAAVAHLQQRAATAVARSDPAAAAVALRALAVRLRDLGEPAMADAALAEAAALSTTGRDTGIGARELTYATRRLGEDELTDTR